MKKLITVLAVLSLVSTASAALVYYTGGTSLYWDDASAWDNAAAPSAGNDYFVNQDYVRVPGGGTQAAFGGDSLHINDSAELALKNDGGDPAEIDVNLFLDGGNLRAKDNLLGSRRWLFSGNMTITTNSSSYNENGAHKQGIEWANTWYGAADLSLDYANYVHTNIFNGADLSNYTGDFSANDYSVVQIDSDPSSDGGLILSSGATLIMNSNFKFDSLTIDGNTVADGRYTAAELGALGYGGNFSGTGSMTVNIPEPTTIGLALVGVFGCMIGRRRIRK